MEEKMETTIRKYYRCYQGDTRSLGYSSCGSCYFKDCTGKCYLSCIAVFAWLAYGHLIGQFSACYHVTLVVSKAPLDPKP